MRVVTFKLDEELLRKLDLYCANNRLFRSEVIRVAIEFYLSNYKSIEEKYSGRTVTEEVQDDNK
jgi:metal-responsive CopG/Arc/MetJ family transcriptional regulator